MSLSDPQPGDVFEYKDENIIFIVLRSVIRFEDEEWIEYLVTRPESEYTNSYVFVNRFDRNLLIRALLDGYKDITDTYK